MTRLNLGGTPLDLGVELTAGSDFVCELTYIDSGTVTDWPAGTTLSLVFDGDTDGAWVATITGPIARFDVDKDQAASVAQSAPVRLQYVNGTTDRALAVGRVKRNG